MQEVEVAFSDLPPGLEGLRIAHLSDLHIRTMRPYEEQVLAHLRALQPDLIVLTGDLVEYAASYDVWAQRVEQVGRFLDGLPTTPYGAWASLGNSDITRYGGHNDLLVRRIRQSGVQLLSNAAAPLEVRGNRLWLLGANYAELSPGFVGDFQTALLEGNVVLAVGKSTGNAFTHYLPENWQPWQGYEFTGRLRYSDPEGGIGVLLGSRFPFGEDHFFRLRRYEDAPTWELSPRGIQITGGSTSSGVQPRANVWYRFRARWEIEQGEARLRSRLWPEADAEPQSWPVDAQVDVARTPGALEPGTIGFWCTAPGNKYVDDLEVRSLDGALLWREDFSRYPPEADPEHWLDFGVNRGNLEEALRGVPSDAFTLLLAHSPDIIREPAATRARLILSGHTHGGQVRLPWIGPLYVNTEVGRKYNAGLFRLQETEMVRWLAVNRGIGTRAVPIRFLCPPEITILTLRRR